MSDVCLCGARKRTNLCVISGPYTRECECRIEWFLCICAMSVMVIECIYLRVCPFDLRNAELSECKYIIQYGFVYVWMGLWLFKGFVNTFI